MLTKDTSKLDLVFILDTTSSMHSYINSAKEGIHHIFNSIIKTENCHLRLGLVNYRDHPPQESTYITEVNELTDDVEKARNFINKTTAHGGGDCPEAICCGMHDCLNKLTWRSDSIKIAILITDAPPHGFSESGDGFPNGCPLNHDPVDIAHKMAEKEIALYCVGCEPTIKSYRPIFKALALITGGMYLSLDDHKDLVQLIIKGAHEEVSMEKLMTEIQNDLLKEANEKGTKINEDELTKRINKLIDSKKPCSKKENRLSIESEISESLKELSKRTNLKDFKDFYENNKNSIENCKQEINAMRKPLIKFPSFLSYFPPKNEESKSKIKFVNTVVKSKSAIRVNKSIEVSKIKRNQIFDLRRSLRLSKKDNKLGSKIEVFHKQGICLRRSLRLQNAMNFIKLKINFDSINKIKNEKLVFKNELEIFSGTEFDTVSRRLAKKAIARNKC